MHRILTALAIVTIQLLSGSICSAENLRLTLSGSSTLAPLASEIAKLLESKNPGLRVDVQTGGSSRGIADVKRGLADLGMSSRDLYEKEKLGRGNDGISDFRGRGDRLGH